MRLPTFSASAHTDLVVLVSEAPQSLQPLSVAEVHLFCYLANLLAVASGRPGSEWGYQFSITSEGFTHAAAIDYVIRIALSRSIVSRSSTSELVPADGMQNERDFLSTLTESTSRREWLMTALKCAVSVPRGVLRAAINQSPGVHANFREQRVAPLLRESDGIDIYDQFQLIREILGEDPTDLLQPAVLWLSDKVLSEY